MRSEAAVVAGVEAPVDALGDGAPAVAPTLSPDNLLAGVTRLKGEVAKVIIGQEQVIEEVLLAILSGGHALLVGVPGLAKTLLIQTIAQAMSLEFRRIQFTPDLVPSDITGTEVMEEDGATGQRAFRFVSGPIFANIILADEINRAPPRTQAAMLEAMQERHVSAGGETMPLPHPFFVLATQNPIEQEGTYPLPEAQLDRFLFDIRVGYPSGPEEVGILRTTTAVSDVQIRPVLDGPGVIALNHLIREIAAPEPALEYAAALARATRPTEPGVPDMVKQYVRWGAGPRAGQALILGAKAHALLHGRLNVSPEDIRRVIHPAMRHRVLPNFAAEAEGITTERIIEHLVETVPPPQSDIPL